MLPVVLETGLELLHVILIDHVDIEVEKVDVVYPIDNIESVGYLDHVRQVLQTESALLLLLASSVSSIGVARSTTVSNMDLQYSIDYLAQLPPLALDLQQYKLLLTRWP